MISAALVLHFPAGTPAALRDALVGRLADFDLVAIHEDDLSAPKTWVVHFGGPSSRDAAAAALRSMPDAAPLAVESADLPDEDWARRTQADLPAIRIGRVTIAPPWDVPPSNVASGPTDVASGPTDVASGFSRTDILVIIEPSRGFGTGHHQSTRLCVLLLQNRDLSRRTAIDVGTGSGVLAITAAKLGAAFVSAIDVDADAVENARENIVLNGVGSVVEAHTRDLVAGSLPPADVVTANLTGTLLVRHAAALARLVKAGGALIVSGFTVDERDAVERAFAPGLALTESAEEEGWWAFVLTPTGT